MPEPGNPGSLNRYSYVLNNPLRYTDPTGHRECERYCSDEIVTAGITSAYAGPWDPVAQARRMQTAQQAAGVAIDFTPVIGDVKGLVEVFTGRDLATGARLGGWRWLGLLGLSEVRHLRHADEVARVLDEIAIARQLIQEAGASGKVIVLGRTMSPRVNAISRLLGGTETFADTSGRVGEELWKANEQWLRSKIADGYVIVNIGADAARGPLAPGQIDFYVREMNVLEGYNTVIDLSVPASDNTGFWNLLANLLP